MECPICKNTMGFAFGTCVECGYNYLDKTFHKIEVNTGVLESLLPKDVFSALVEEHLRYKKR